MADRWPDEDVEKVTRALADLYAAHGWNAPTDWTFYAPLVARAVLEASGAVPESALAGMEEYAGEQEARAEAVAKALRDRAARQPYREPWRWYIALADQLDVNFNDLSRLEPERGSE